MMYLMNAQVGETNQSFGAFETTQKEALKIADKILKGFGYCSIEVLRRKSLFTDWTRWLKVSREKDWRLKIK